MFFFVYCSQFRHKLFREWSTLIWYLVGNFLLGILLVCFLSFFFPCHLFSLRSGSVFLALFVPNDFLLILVGTVEGNSTRVLLGMVCRFFLSSLSAVLFNWWCLSSSLFSLVPAFALLFAVNLHKMDWWIVLVFAFLICLDSLSGFICLTFHSLDWGASGNWTWRS